jgi:hypothetical protein
MYAGAQPLALLIMSFSEGLELSVACLVCCCAVSPGLLGSACGGCGFLLQPIIATITARQTKIANFTLFEAI